MYVFEHYATTRDEFGELRGPWVTTLWEMTAKELAETEAEGDHDPLVWYERTTAQRAHAWVRQGGRHNTPLYIDWTDSGREVIRYARDAS